MSDAYFASYLFITLFSASVLLVYFPKVKVSRILCFFIYLVLNAALTFAVLVYRHNGPRGACDWLVYIAVLAVYGIAMILLSDGSLTERLVIYSVCANAMLLTMMTAMCFAVAFYEDNFIAHIITLIVFQILSEFIPLPSYRRRFREISFGRDSSWLVILAMLLMLFCFTAVILTLFSVYRPEASIAFLMLLCLLFIFYSVCLLALKLILFFRREAEHKAETIGMKIISSRLKQYEEAEEKIRQERHDIRHHLRVLGEFASKGDLEGLSGYLELDGILASPVKHYSADRALDNVICAYVRIAEEAGCCIDTDIRLDNGISGINDADMTVLVANLMENAIAGACRSGKRACVALSVLGRNSHLSLTCTNPSRSDVVFHEGLPTENGSLGTGMISIRNVVRKYSGEVAYSLEDGNMEARIILNR